MGERIFTLADIAGVTSACGCLGCQLGAAFADHLTGLRTGYPGQVVLLEHREARPGTTAVPHFLAVRLDTEMVDVVVWEEMCPAQLAAWLPSLEGRERMRQVARRIPRLVRLRQALRSGTFTPSGEVAAALATGRYPSFKFLVEHWPTLEKEFIE